MEHQVLGKALLQPDSILTQTDYEIAPVLQVTVSFKHLVALNNQSDLQSIPGDGTWDMRGKARAGSLLGKSLFWEGIGVYFLYNNVWVLNKADSLQTGTRDTATFMMDAVRNSMWLLRANWHMWDPSLAAEWLRPHSSGQSTDQGSESHSNSVHGTKRKNSSCFLVALCILQGWIRESSLLCHQIPGSHTFRVLL